MMRIVKHTLCVGVLLTPLWAQPGGGNKEFDVASVKQNKSGDPPPYSNNPLGPGTVFVPNGGRFFATDLPLITYIAFAYKVQGNQQKDLMAQLPDWVNTENFDIDARTNGNVTKDEMRQLMQSLLADRFKLKIRTETRQVPVLAMTLAKEGKFGPKLQPHPAAACKNDPPPTNGEMLGVFPALCGGFLGLAPTSPGLQNVGARDITMAFLANGLTAMSRSDRPVIDNTGLSGTFDMALEWEPDPAPGQPAADAPSGAPFFQAVKEQLGIKLESQKGPVDVLVVDHIEHLFEN